MLKVYDAFNGLLRVLRVGHHVLLFHCLLVEVDILARSVHAGPWLVEHGILRVDGNLWLVIEKDLILTRGLLAKSNGYLLILKLHLFYGVSV